MESNYEKVLKVLEEINKSNKEEIGFTIEEKDYSTEKFDCIGVIINFNNKKVAVTSKAYLESNENGLKGILERFLEESYFSDKRRSYDYYEEEFKKHLDKMIKATTNEEILEEANTIRIAKKLQDELKEDLEISNLIEDYLKEAIKKY